MKWRDEPIFELDVRIDKKFAFTPQVMKNGETIWLEFYYKKYRFESYGYTEKIENGEPKIFGQMVNGGMFYEQECSQNKSELISPIDNFYRLRNANNLHHNDNTIRNSGNGVD